ncbi:MAG: cupredoxin domain-containing protein [Alphaproteobacteria bacterium]|nr:cupredoxin domain-containing protein [Alphaproteobacteria bacterium]
MKGPAAILLLAIALAAAAHPAAAAERRVEITGYEFRPGRVAVKTGDKVLFLNTEKRTSHDVVFEDGVLSERLMPGDAFSRVFDKPGLYRFHCAPHPHMVGEVLVE